MAEQSSVMYASATRRGVAFVADSLILGLLTVIIVKLLVRDVLMQQAVARLASALYFILIESSGRMASLGKSLMKIYVAMDEGKRARLGTLALRYLILMLPGLPLLFVAYSSEYLGVLQTIQQYSDARDMQGMMNYLRSPEAAGIVGRLKTMAAISGALGIGLVWLPIVFTKQKTGLHDHLTKTRVFKRTA
jgi:uncharacterized RDD family membrane protein YckC